MFVSAHAHVCICTLVCTRVNRCIPVCLCTCESVFINMQKPARVSVYQCAECALIFNTSAYLWMRLDAAHVCVASPPHIPESVCASRFVSVRTCAGVACMCAGLCLCVHVCICPGMWWGAQFQEQKEWSSQTGFAAKGAGANRTGQEWRPQGKEVVRKQETSPLHMSRAPPPPRSRMTGLGTAMNVANARPRDCLWA